MKNDTKKQNLLARMSPRGKMLLLIGVVLLIVIVIMLFSLLSQEERVVEPGSVDQSLSYGYGAEIIINDETESKTEGEMYVHRVKDIDHTSVVQEFLIKLGKGLWTKEAFGDSYVVWRENSSDDLYLVDYNGFQERAFFRFPQPIPLDQIKGDGVLGNDQLLDYLELFVNNYFDMDFTYTNVKVFKDGGNFRIEGNREINGLKLEISGFHDYSDYIIVTPEGDIVEGQVILLEYENGGSMIDVMNPDLVSTVINDYEYPKEFNQRMPEDFAYPNSIISNIDPSAPHAPYLEDKYKIPSVEKCKVESMELVYFFSGMDAEHLAPAYKLDCWGVVELQGEEYRVQNIIYTNAIDPQFVESD